MGEDAYSAISIDLGVLYPDFDRHQREAADAVRSLIESHVKSGRIDTIIDLGCGIGAILNWLSESRDMESVRLVGVDCSDESLRLAQAKASEIGCRAPTFLKCEESTYFPDFIEQEIHGCTDDEKAFSDLMSRTAVICTSHTIFHLSYLEQMFKEYRQQPSKRPAIWLIDVHRGWDGAIEKAGLGQRVLEPKSIFRNPDGSQSIYVLFTEPAGEEMVRRGLLRLTSPDMDESVLISTTQVAWPASRMAAEFARTGYMLETSVPRRTGWGDMQTYVFALPPVSLLVAELWGSKWAASTRRLTSTSGEKGRLAHSPLPPLRDWIRACDVMTEGGLQTLLIEFVPYFDSYEARKDLSQEVLLVGRKSKRDGSSNLAHLLAEYNAVAAGLQRNDLGLYLHDYMTGHWQMGDGLPTETSESVRASHSNPDGTVQSVSGPTALAWLEAKAELLSDEPGDVVLTDFVTMNGIESADFRVPIIRLGADLSQAKIARMRSRIRKDHPDVAYKTARDYALVLDLLHRTLRNRLGCAADQRTALISAPLSPASAGRDYRPDGLLIPSSYRGSIWIFARMAETYEQSTSSTLRELLKVGILEGSASVEAIANDALAEGITHFAKRTASVAIMSRNLSHNIGSHVLSSVVAEPIDEADISERHILFQYLQERMDFLAEVSTSVAYMSLPLSLDYVLGSFQEQRLLNKYVSGTAKNDRSRVKASFLKPDPDRARLFLGDNVLASIPGGRNGCQAFFTVLENIIRNSAKHRSAASRDQDVVIGVRSTIEGDFIKIGIWDNASNGRSETTNKLPLFEYINTLIDSGSVIEADGSLRRGGWGIREIMIAVAYLREIPLEDVEHWLQGERPLLRACVAGDIGEPAGDQGPAHLCYEFYLKRPRTMLVVDPELYQSLDDAQLESLRRQGIGIQSEVGNERVGYRYLVCPDAIELSIPAEWPGQRIEPDEKLHGIIHSSTDKSSDELGMALWEWAAKAWLGRVLDRHGIAEVRACGAKDGRLGFEDWQSAADKGCTVAFVHHHQHASADTKAHIEGMLFWESYEGPYEQTTLIEAPPKGSEGALGFEFLAAAAARIVVLDERVQSATEQHPGYWPKVLTMSEAVRLRRIEVPHSHHCPLDSAPSWEKIESYLDSIADKPIDFIVVHLGILERMTISEAPQTDGEPVKTSPAGWSDALERLRSWTHRGEASRRPEIVICSGRGPNEVWRAEVRFVPASQVERWTAHVPSKYHLYQLLASSRRPESGGSGNE